MGRANICRVLKHSLIVSTAHSQKLKFYSSFLCDTQLHYRSHLYWHQSSHCLILGTLASLHHGRQFIGKRPAGRLKVFSIAELCWDHRLPPVPAELPAIQNLCVVRGLALTTTHFSCIAREREWLREGCFCKSWERAATRAHDGSELSVVLQRSERKEAGNLSQIAQRNLNINTALSHSITLASETASSKYHLLCVLVKPVTKFQYIPHQFS